MESLRGGCNAETSEISDDPFVVGLLQRMPAPVRETFTDEQLLGLKVALGARQWRRHPVDVRGAIGFWRWRYYYVVVAGRERRLLTRREELLARAGRLALLAGFLTCSALLGLLILYLVKSALGIDLIPGYSLGIWDWFNGLFL
jgi:hypothetical protein